MHANGVSLVIFSVLEEICHNVWENYKNAGEVNYQKTLLLFISFIIFIELIYCYTFFISQFMSGVMVSFAGL